MHGPLSHCPHGTALPNKRVGLSLLVGPVYAFFGPTVDPSGSPDTVDVGALGYEGHAWGCCSDADGAPDDSSRSSSSNSGSCTE